MRNKGSKIMSKMNVQDDTKKTSDERKYVFLVLSQTSTFPAKMIRWYTREPYAHASIALDVELREMYSFARKKVNNPWNNGFIKEDIEAGVFGKFKETKCSIYALEVSDEQYQRLKEEIQVFKDNQDIYTYNYLGIVGAMIHRPVERETRYFCSQFVAYILEKSGIDLFHKNCGLVRPKDFRLCPKLSRIYKGKIRNYRTSWVPKNWDMLTKEIHTLDFENFTVKAFDIADIHINDFVLGD